MKPETAPVKRPKSAKASQTPQLAAPQTPKAHVRAKRTKPRSIFKVGVPTMPIPLEASGRPVVLTNFGEMYRATPVSRVNLIKQGVPASEVKAMLRQMNYPQDKFVRSLGLSIATLNRKATKNQALSQSDSERVVGMSQLIGQVQTMVEQSGNAQGFDAAKWVTHWLDEPLPALGDARPIEYLDTMEGQRIVSNLLAMMQSGAYA